MTAALVTGFVAAVVALGFGMVIDRGGDRIVRLAKWPFPTMPATNGVIFAIILGGFIALAVTAPHLTGKL